MVKKSRRQETLGVDQWRYSSFLEDVILAEETEEPGKFYRNATAEIRAELGKEIIGSFGKGRRLPAVLAREDCYKLMEAYTKGKHAFRNNLLSRVLYATGLRIEEAETLNFADIDHKRKTVFVRSGKGDKDRYVCIDSETLALLKEWQGDKPPKEAVFGVSDRQLRRIVEKAGVLTGVAKKYEGMERRFSPHSLRHAFATHCYENGMEIFSLKKLMGHEYLATTMMYVYTDLRFDMEEYEKAGPFV